MHVSSRLPFLRGCLTRALFIFFIIHIFARVTKMSPYNSNRPVISRRAFFLLLGYMSACAAAQDDRINFRGQLGFNDLADCASCFFAGFGQCPLLEDEVGCMTDKCLCQSNHLDKGVEFISDSVISKCSDEQDQAAATDFLKSYCAEHGATEVAAPDSSTGASAVTVTITHTLATATVTVPSAAGQGLCPAWSWTTAWALLFLAV
jgi:hypothetical protein